MFLKFVASISLTKKKKKRREREREERNFTIKKERISQG